MIKLTPLRNKVPLVIALAIAALIAAGQSASAAVDTRISTNAQQEADAADIEQIGAVGVKYSNDLASGTIKLSNGNVKALASVLASAIQAKQGPTDTGANRLSNKADEIAEGAAVIAAGIAKSPTFAKKAGDLALNILKGALQTAKKNAAVIGNSSPNLFQDVAGSVMLTLVRSGDTTEKLDSKIYKYLKLNASLASGGKNSKAIKLGLKEGLANDAVANGRYEDGTLGPVIDPETDTRNT